MGSGMCDIWRTNSKERRRMETEGEETEET